MPDQSNQLLDPNTPLGEQIAQNPVGAQLLWGIDPQTLQPKQQLGNVGYNYLDPAEAIMHLPQKNVALGFGTSPATFVGEEAAMNLAKAGISQPMFDLQKAGVMEQAGAHPQDIWQSTGWGRDPHSGQWTMEVSDKGAMFGGAKGSNPTLSDIYVHPELYTARPDLQKVPVGAIDPKEYPGLAGAYFPHENFVGFNPEHLKTAKDYVTVAAHETQHAADKGANYPGSSEGSTHMDYNSYMNDPMEKRAYSTESRLDMTPEERRASMPSFMIQDAQGNQHTLTPVQGNPITGGQASYGNASKPPAPASPGPFEVQPQAGRQAPTGNNFRTSLSDYTPHLFRQVSPDEAQDFIPGLRIVDKVHDEPYFADHPNMALGQGKNANGILLSFDSSAIEGQVNRNKPMWQPAFENGAGEYIGRLNRQSTYQNALTGVRIPSNLPMSRQEAKMLSIGAKKLITNGWTEHQGDGYVEYRKPSQDNPIQGTP